MLTQRWSQPLRKRVLDLGVYGHTDYTPFVILARSRVGSNLLRGLLNSHPRIVAFGEVFRDIDSVDWDHLGYFQSARTSALIRQDAARFLDRRLFGRYPGGVGAVGFKLFYYHAREGTAAAAWPYLAQRPDVRILHLKRRNILQTHLSRKRAALTDRWVNTSGRPDGDGAVVVTLDYDECLRDFVQTRTWEEQCEREFTGHPTLSIDYEALAADYAGESARIQEFLGVPHQAVTPSTYQQARHSLSATIANYAELKRRFAGTEWEGFFIE